MNRRLGSRAFFPVTFAIDSAPQGATFVGAVSWSFHAGAPGQEGYFVCPSPRPEWEWVLWVFRYDDDAGAWTWAPRACTTRRFASDKDAAQYLLTASWRAERTHRHTPLFDEVEDDGLLSRVELRQLGASLLADK